MRRRTLLSLGALSPLALFISRYLSARTPRVAVDYRAQAEQLHELAANIQTSSDARHMVDFIAGVFSEDMPSALLTGSLRGRVAQAEFSAVANPRQLIAETRLVEAWNAYVQTIQAPAEHQATAAEVHNLRDAFWTMSRASWERGIRNIWAVPSIYATQPDGMLAPGCRAVESIRILWDLANTPSNHMAARDRVGRGELASDLFRQQQRPAQAAGRVVGMRQTAADPMALAQIQYVKVNGVRAFNKAVIAMLDGVLA